MALPLVKTIRDINDKFSYTDENPGGKRDDSLVSCGQNGSYNELQYIYDTYLAPKVALNKFTKQEALNALNSACFDISSPRTRTRFYTYIETYLGETIFPK
ncbi:hypothetical protein [Marinomonas arenicola]|uniref:Uncharacterized protein n=1 Tax=Marinomonas arenicola TaxID=569601 RepID=A0ABU9G8D8_9GAMM